MFKFLSATPCRLLLAFFCFGPLPVFAQTAFLDFNTVGEYANNFNPWNDTGGVNGGRSPLLHRSPFGDGQRAMLLR